MKAAAAGRVLLLSRATAARWGKKVRNGEPPLEPRPSRPRTGSGKLETCMPFFAELIEHDPDITLAELQAALGDEQVRQERRRPRPNQPLHA